MPVAGAEVAGSERTVLVDGTRLTCQPVWGGARLTRPAGGGGGETPPAREARPQPLKEALAPPVRQFGAIGTGDLHALASTALCLLGELPWHGGTTPPGVFDAGDALAFISSSAATLGEAALACEDVRDLLNASLVVAALSSFAVDGDASAY